MHCALCNYTLDGLPAGVCPECGEAFDQANARSFRTMSAHALAGRGKMLWILLVTSNVVLVSPTLFAWLAALDARQELGRWPVPIMDDPKGLALVLPFDELFWMSIFLGLFAVVVAVMTSLTAIATGAKRKWRMWILYGCLGLLGPVVFFAGFALSPHVYWMLD
jgi:hypothetical protein